MSTISGTKIIAPNEFFVRQRLKDPDNPDLILFLKACGKEVDRLVVLFAQKCYLS